MKKQVIISKKLLNTRMEAYINKCVDFQYHGEKLKFYLSHELFSSYDIDAGTRLLLKTIARNIEFGNIRKIKDIGCGSGVIGICLKKKNPHVSVHFTDRDHLALKFTEENCHLNGIKEFEITGELGTGNASESFDLITSNIPAKIGSRALEVFVAGCAESLAEQGICAIVIIKAHAEEIEQAIHRHAVNLVYKEETERHTVFHFTGYRQNPAARNLLTPYIRSNQTFTLQDCKYKLDTVFNLPDFDTIGYQVAGAAAVCRKHACSGHCLYWNPGQGHFPVYCYLKNGNHIRSITLAGRDLLQLHTAQHNLVLNGFPAVRLAIRHLSFLIDCGKEYDSLAVFPDNSPVMHLQKQLITDIKEYYRAGVEILIAARSSYLGRWQQELSGLKQIKHKDKGYCGILLTQE